MPNPDFSEYVVHFTKNTWPWSAGRSEAEEFVTAIRDQTAFQRLHSILRERRIRATSMPWTGKPSVCFTECVWGSLLDHATTYSSFGVGFHKSFLFANDGGPAVYIRQDVYQAQIDAGGFADEVWPFITPFVPAYASDEHRERFWRPPKPFPLDYTREREWRVPRDLYFDLVNVAFVIVASEVESQMIDPPIRATLGPMKILFMNNYRLINAIWPWHHY
jgi:hypothetical protein